MVVKSLAKLSQTFSKWRRSSIDRQLRPRTHSCYAYLRQHQDRVVSKDELLREVWPRRVVTEQSLFQCVAEIRSQLGGRCIRTVPGDGYQWCGASMRWPAAGVFAATVLTVAGALAVLTGQEEERIDAVRLSPVVAMIPATKTLEDVEIALGKWLSQRVPAELITGTAALAHERDGNSDVTVRLSEKGANVIAYTVRTLGMTMNGELPAVDTAELVERLGVVVREAVLQNQRSGAVEHQTALFASVLAAWMEHDVASTAALAEVLFAQYPDYLPGHSLMIEVEIADDRLAAANDRANSMIAQGVATKDAAWLAAGHIALSRLSLHEGMLREAEVQALRAIDVATGAGLSRQAGKAAEFLAAVGESRDQSQVAINWLVEAYSYYEEGRCTVGTARVDRSIRDLLKHEEGTG